MRIDRIELTKQLTAKDLTIRRLSELSDVSTVTISGIKGGKRCTDETGLKLAAALGIPIEQLVQQ